MSKKRHKTDEIVTKLRQVEVLTAQEQQISEPHYSPHEAVGLLLRLGDIVNGCCLSALKSATPGPCAAEPTQNVSILNAGLTIITKMHTKVITPIQASIWSRWMTWMRINASML